VDGVTISFRGVQFAYTQGTPVLTVPSLDVGAGLTLLLGANGAGKTTLMRLAAGVERPDAGTVTIGGHDLWSDEITARRELAYVPEQPDLTPYATVIDVLTLVARLRGEPASESQRALAEAGLAGLGRRTIRELSQGQRRRAMVAAATIGTPRVLILDEPSAALDAEMRARLFIWIDAALARGATVLVSTHDAVPFDGRAARIIHVVNGLIM
jgi:ABC-type multidrug transport system ATPase subunit